MKKIRTLIIILCACFQFEAFSQSRMVGVMPMQYNPSFAGSTGATRFVMTGKNISRKGDYNPIYRSDNKNIGISADNFFTKIGTGIGAHCNYAVGDEIRGYSGSVRFNDINSGIVISPKISLKGKYTLAPSLGLNYRKITLYHTNPSVMSDSNKDLNIMNSEKPYLSVGLLFNTKKFYIGYSYIGKSIHGGKDNRTRNISQYMIRDFGDNHFLQLGYNFQKKEDSKFSLSTQVLFTYRDYDYINYIPEVTLTARYKKFLFGLNMDHYSGLNPFIGFQHKNIRLLYSQNFNFNTGVRGEISVRFLIPNKKGKTPSGF